VALTAVAAALALTACGAGNTDNKTTSSETASAAESSAAQVETASSELIAGTTDKVTFLDPAGSYDNGSYHVEIQVYQFLYGFKPGDASPQPDAAEKCEYTSDTVLQCKLKSGLMFANGHALTASDVKVSFDRQLEIYYDNGPASLLSNLASVDIVDDLTVNFNLKAGPDQTFLQILATPVGPIVDEEVFSATELTSDADIVAGNAFSGPYVIDSWKINDTVHLTPYPAYNGVQGEVQNDGVTITYYSESTNLKLALENGDIDMALRSLTPTDIESLKTNSNVKVWEGPGGEIRYIVFNLNTMPGDTAEQKLAVRQAIASVVDREALSTEVYKGLYTPLCSWVPDGLPGANTAACDTYPLDTAKAAQYLSDAGVATPVVLNLQYNPDHYGSSSDQEYARIKAQLEASGLFTVNLQSTEWVQYSADRSADVYPLYQLGWFPDYPDADNYLAPFFVKDNFLNNHFDEPEVQELIAKEQTTADATERANVIGEIQTVMAEKYLSTLPLLQGTQVLAAATDVQDIVLDASFQFRYATVSKA
jgi:peptide/nickel transport system substrate-binding protein